MNALVLYDSKYGNTERLARAIAYRISALQVMRVDDVESTDLASCDLLVVGGPTHIHGMSVTMRDFIESLSRGALSGVPAAVFDTRYRGSQLITGSAAHSIVRHLRRAGARVVLPAESFFVVKSDDPKDTRLAEGELERAVTWAAALLHETVVTIEQDTAQRR
jgi:flavodoxin